MLWESKRQALRIYILRVLNWQFNNSPFLSGDTFSDLCDTSYARSIFRIRSWKKLWKFSEIVFVPGHRFEDFLAEIEKFPRVKVLIIGNSDRDWHSFDYELPSQIKVIFLQNSFIESPKVRFLPIGLENRKLGVNGLPSRIVKVVKTAGKDRLCCEKPLLTHVSPTHESRMDLYAEIENFHYLPERLSPEKYLLAISRHRFVICPRGNGIDTHRFWESLYLNSFPVVVASQWSNLLKNQSTIPFIEVVDWKSVPTAIQNFRESDFSANEIPELWESYWKQLFISELES